MTRSVRITPVSAPLLGKLVLPGSKSITNRALLLAGLAKGTSRLTGALKSDDTGYMARALRAMGVAVEEPDKTTFVVTGTGRLEKPDETLLLGNAGTATRFLAAAVATVDGAVVIDGDDHMRKRPIGPLIDALNTLGVKASAPTGSPPAVIGGEGGLPGGRVEIDAGLSSQYASALLMAGACAKADLEVALAGPEIGARGYIDLTLAAMQAFGGEVEPLGNHAAWKVRATGYRAADFAIEPDASAATYPWAWAAITGGALDLGRAPDDFTQPDARAHAHIAEFPNMPAEIDGLQMQDAVPTLAVLAAYNEHPVRFTRIAGLRIKECDRIAVLDEGLNRIRPGLAHEDGDDLVVAGDPSLRGAQVAAVIDPHADHRMAMAFAIAALVTDGIVIEDPGCVAKTWPGYWDALAALGVKLAFED
jgi:3-phosphoshikimate 1-carboxyvinyltransferase